MTDITNIGAALPELIKTDLVRHVEFRATPTADGLTLDGYAAVFNAWTLIDSYEGTFRERIAPGAFKRTIGQHMPVLQFDHGTHPVIGSIPLGRITSIVEDTHGLHVKARLSDNWLVQPVRDAIVDGSITGMSFRFSVTANGDMLATGADGILERTITEVALYEVGPVVFPAYEQTSVGVRSRDAIDALTDPDVRREIAHALARGTDLTGSPAIVTAPDIVHAASDTTTTPADGHAVETKPPTRTKTQRVALALVHTEGFTP